MLTRTLGWLLGLENVQSIDSIEVGLAAAWAQGGGLFWVVAGCVVFFAVALAFYYRYQQRGSVATRTTLGVLRGLLLSLLFVTLAYPVLRVTVTNNPRPLLYVLFDGTDSMAIEDELSDEQKAELTEAIGIHQVANTGGTPEPPAEDANTRLGYIKRLLNADQRNVLERIQNEKEYRLEAFIFDGANTSQLRKLNANNSGRREHLEPAIVADQLTSTGQVTAIGTVFSELNQQLGSGNLAGVIVFSDFAQNSGVAPVGDSSGQNQSPVSRLGVPVYTVGIGATKAIDLALDVQPPIKMKRAERTSIRVKWSQTGLENQSATIRVTARKLGGSAEEGDSPEILVGEKTITMDSNVDYIDLPFTPEEAGRFEFIAEVDEQDGEVLTENNRSVREVNIIDDYLRLTYAAYEPTWEWRFVKEVFHRDKLVGMRGFRTFLRSADPKVRQTNELFLPTLTTKPSEFFANDIIFLGDMPSAVLSQTFCENVKRFVSEFGGGLVVIAGPRFGPGELANTPLADMLPVEVDPSLSIRDSEEFGLEITPLGLQTDFMQLGEADNPQESLNAWRNLGKLPWYQPVKKPHPLAYVLAEHPTHVCPSDGKTRQPIIAYRRYGRGEVVYIGFNETWRLRRKYGERYYRQFWSQMMNRLALSHALGNQKRFVVRTDRQRYQPDDKVTLMVEAYDENFDRLEASDLPDHKLSAELIVPGSDGQSDQVREISLSQLRVGEFEARLPVYAAGEYRVRVKDPIAEEYSEVRFQVANVSAERQSAVRDEALQSQIAASSGGRSYDLTNVSQLVDDLQVQSITEKFKRNRPLWATPLWFIAVVGLMLSEWLVRKMINLT